MDKNHTNIFTQWTFLWPEEKVQERYEKSPSQLQSLTSGFWQPPLFDQNMHISSRHAQQHRYTCYMPQRTFCSHWGISLHLYATQTVGSDNDNNFTHSFYITLLFIIDEPLQVASTNKSPVAFLYQPHTQKVINSHPHFFQTTTFASPAVLHSHSNSTWY